MFRLIEITVYVDTFVLKQICDMLMLWINSFSINNDYFCDNNFQLKIFVFEHKKYNIRHNHNIQFIFVFDNLACCILLMKKVYGPFKF